MSARLEGLAGTRRGAAWLFAAALGVYWLVSIGLPLVAGRDFPTYVSTWVQLDRWDSVLPMTMLYRTPLAPILGVGPLDLLGPWGAQVWFSLLYAGSIVAWSSVALRAGRRAALATAIALLLYPGYVLLFHRLASDAVFAAVFAGFALALARAFDRPGARRFALVGLAIGLLALTRPGNQALLVVALAPLVLGGPWRTRVAWVGVIAGVALVLLGGWALNNGLRYHDTTVARGSAAYLPFFRLLTTDHLVDPANGPTSRALSDALERHVLTREPYRSRGIDLETFLGRATDRQFEDVLNVADLTWGWDDDYHHLRDVAVETIRAHPWGYVSGVGRTLWQLAWRPFYYELPAGAGSETAATAADGAGGARLLSPRSGEPGDELVPAASRGFYYTTPGRWVDEVWTSPNDHHPVFERPGDGERFDAIVAELAPLTAKLPAYSGVPWIVRQVSRASRLWPRPALWLVVGLAAVVWRRPRGSALALVLAGASLLVLVLDAAAIYAIAEFVVPVVPAFVVLAAAGVLGDRPPGAVATVRRS